ncbi:hypothetical protein C8R45DRAFT_388346 [Mycena sanguinolenta]|nr:hypothetical protein C8R45DRAFT_388346 [Mycena sanguinolenta]
MRLLPLCLLLQSYLANRPYSNFGRLNAAPIFHPDRSHPVNLFSYQLHDMSNAPGCPRNSPTAIWTWSAHFAL